MFANKSSYTGKADEMKFETGYESLMLRKYLEELEADHPLPARTYSEKDIAKINFCHALEVDRLYRDKWGGRSELLSCIDGHIELEAYIENDFFVKAPREICRFYPQIEAWFSNRFLRKAKCFTIHVYATRHAGALTATPREDALEVNPDVMMRAYMPRPPADDIKVEEWTGQLGKAGELIDTPIAFWPENTY